MKNGGKAMALKKYRFAVGICGPTVLYTNIIRAEDERSAAMIYLSEIGKDLTDENISEQLRHIKEIVPKETPDRLLDYLEKEIVLGDEVMFIKNKYGEAPRLMPGKVDKISGKSIVITTESGESNRVILSEKDDECLSRVIVMQLRPERKNNGVADASGYPLIEGDPVVYMKTSVHNRCDGFQTGMITRFTAKYIEINGTKRTSERVIAINW